MVKILVAESLQVETLEDLAKEHSFKIYYNDDYEPVEGSNHHFIYKPDIKSEDIEAELAKDYDCLVVRPKEVNGSAIANAENLKLIVRGGAGLNSIDLEEAEKCSVTVQNTPGQNSISTAEYSFALIMQVVAKRNIIDCANNTRNLKDIAAEHYQGEELFGKKIGIIGLGNIGRLVADRCAAFGMEIEIFSRSKKDIEFTQHENLEDLLSSGLDIISLHIPLTDSTDKILSDNEFNLLKEGTILINAARPQLVDPVAFGNALKSGKISSYAIDGDMDLLEPFLEADSQNRGILTNHIADSTLQAQSKITRQVIKQILQFF